LRHQVQRSRGAEKFGREWLFEHTFDRHHSEVIGVLVDSVLHHVDLTQHRTAVELEPSALELRSYLRDIGPDWPDINLDLSKLSVLTHKPKNLPKVYLRPL